MSRRRLLRNALIREYGSGRVAEMTREQLDARVGYLRAQGRHFDALDLVNAWLASLKTQQERLS